MDFYRKESLRYFVNIVSKFTRPVLNAIEKVKDLPIDIIAPSHGLVWRKDPGLIVELYKKWSEYALGPTETGITLLYGTMYGNTEVMMNAVAQGIASEGVPVSIFDAARTHPSYILPSLWTQKGVLIGAPTYEASLFPPIAQVLEIASLKRVMNKKTAMFGSFGWSKGALAEIKKMTEPLKWEMAWALDANAKYSEAAVAAQKAGPGIQSAQIFDHAGHIAQKLNRGEDAAKYFKLAIQSNPNRILPAMLSSTQARPRPKSTSCQPTLQMRWRPYRARLRLRILRSPQQRLPIQQRYPNTSHAQMQSQRLPQCPRLCSHLCRPTPAVRFKRHS